MTTTKMLGCSSW